MPLLASVACGSSTAAINRSGPTSSSSPPAHAATARCGPAGAHTLAAGSSARVYATGPTIYGCSARTGRVTRLGTSGPCNAAQHVGPFAIAGQLAAYGLETCGVDTGSSQVVVRRLSDGKVLLSEPAITGSLGPESFSSVTSVVVTTGGAVGWIGSGSSIVRHSEVIEVHSADQHAQRLLDSGASIDGSSLRLHGSRLSWRHGGTTRSAKLS